MPGRAPAFQLALSWMFWEFTQKIRPVFLSPPDHWTKESALGALLEVTVRASPLTCR